MLLSAESMESSDRIACHVCGKYFDTSVSVRMHMMRVHGKVSSVQDGQQHDLPTDTAAVSAPVGKKGSLCSVCNRCFPNARALALHARFHVAADSDAVTTAAPKQQCRECGKYFVNLIIM